ncbi:hypothetical protein CEP88_13390 [Roseobacter denitrificans]|uniref:hypothetical protein n=1 Tax=Roseobacter denitrificans TaxID=2434 RepID=UPI0002E3033D|nr:hypothetical protein [Roseobacter denitrificans]AVL53509.1 hypothetical protein CEP88_13390 [Roseobacter denitrificans]SFF71796.1 hypothetical protein SAMN05443635_101348 [Roseobacter denitrificans OCh 114]
MLWLAGLMGVIGVSAASFFVSQPETDPENGVVDGDLGPSDHCDLILVSGQAYTLGPDLSGDPFLLSPDRDEGPEPPRKEDYVFGPTPGDHHTDLAGPVSPTTDMPVPFAVLGQDKDIFVDRLPSDKGPLFPDRESVPDPLWLRMGPLSGALDKEMLNDTAHDPHANSIAPDTKGRATQTVDDTATLPQDQMIEDTSAPPFAPSDWKKTAKRAKFWIMKRVRTP